MPSVFIFQYNIERCMPSRAAALLDDQDLIHKAAGWMLREVGKRDRPILEAFLKENYRKMPRTMLRYATERLDQEDREAYLKGLV